MKALVIAGDSLAGQYMADYLHALGHSVVTTVTTLEDMAEKRTGTLEVMDILNPVSIRRVIAEQQPDYVFNFSAQNSVGQAWADPGLTVDLNVNGVLNLFGAVQEMKTQPVVLLVGSGDEYGRADFSEIPMKESMNPQPTNILAATKVCQAMMAQIYCHAYGMHLIVARAFNDVGPGQSAQFAVSDFCRQAVRIERGLQEPVLQIGNPNSYRDFTDIRDQVRAFWLLAQRGRDGEVYNVGSGRASSIREIVSMIQLQTVRPFRMEVDEMRIRALDSPKIEADMTKMRRDTGWMAEIPLEETIADMLDDWRNKME